MTPDPDHPLCPVARRVLTRRGIYRHAPGYSVAVETIDDDTDLDRMTVTIHVTRPGVVNHKPGSVSDKTGCCAPVTEKWGPMRCEGQAKLGVKDWERAWASVLEQSLDRAEAEVVAKAVKDHNERSVLECRG